jgi:phage-related holin
MPSYVRPFVAPILDPTAQVAICTVLLLIALDLVVGITGAVVTHTFSSEKMRAGLLHKFMELSAMALAIILDGALVSGLDLATQPLLLATCAYVGIMETGSILELIKKYDPDAEGLVGWLTSFVAPKGGE